MFVVWQQVSSLVHKCDCSSDSLEDFEHDSVSVFSPREYCLGLSNCRVKLCEATSFRDTLTVSLLNNSERECVYNRVCTRATAMMTASVDWLVGWLVAGGFTDEG